MFEAGQRIADLVVEERIGQGGFGTVYRARTPVGHLLAVKVTNTPVGALSTREMVLQQNELEALSKLAHPVVVDVRRHGLLPDGRLYLAMELVHGDGLDRHLRRRGRLEPIEALEIVSIIVSGLAHCHTHGVLHLDLKPANIILIDPHAPVVKVLDFGLAHMRGSWRAADGAISGTPVYMAPEALENARSAATPAADLYAVGVILYELMTGEVPFDAPTPMGLLARKRSKVKKPLDALCPGVSMMLVELVDALLAPDPKDRPASASELEKLLGEVRYDILGVEPSVDASAIAPTAGAPRERPFIGRQRELAALSLRWSTSQARTGQAAALVAGPGVGKSRLVAEFLRGDEIHRRAQIGYGRCREVGGLVPYLALREALGQLIGGVQRQGRRRAAALSEALSAELGEDAALMIALVPEVEKLLTAESVRARVTLESGAGRVGRLINKALRALASTAPVLLILEDIHWADEGEVEAVRSLLAEGLPKNVMLLATARPGREPFARQLLPIIEVEPLSKADATTLLTVALGTANTAVLQRLFDKVPLLRSGNPLFALQVIHDLTQTGCVTLDHGRATGIDEVRLAQYSPPHSVFEVLERIIERLSERARTVLAVAALMGRTFELADLHGVRLFEAGDTNAALDEALEHHLCQCVDDTWTFVHDTIREQLERGIEKAMRPVLHRRIADQLRARRADPGALAHHLHRAGDLWEAACCYVEAATQANTLHDLVGASHQLEAAVDLLLGIERTRETDRALADAVFELVRVASQAGNTERTRSYLERAASQLTRAAQDTRLALDSAFARLHYTRGELSEAFAYARSCLEHGLGEPRRARYQLAPANILGRGLCVSGRFAQAAELLTKGCELAREQGDMAELSHSMGMLGLSLGFMGEHARAQTLVLEGADLARELGDPVRTLGALFYASIAGEYTFDWDYGVRISTQALRFAAEKEVGGLYLYLTHIFAGRHQFHLGRLRSAEILLQRALKLSDELNITMGRGWANGFLADVLLVRGAFDEANQRYYEGIEASRRGTGDELGAGICLSGLFHTTALTGGAPTEVRQLAEEAIARADEHKNLYVKLTALQRFAECHEIFGDRARADELRASWESLADSLRVPKIDWWPRIPPAQDRSPQGDAPGPHTTRRSFWMSVPSRSAQARDAYPNGGDTEFFSLDDEARATEIDLLSPEAVYGGPKRDEALAMLPLPTDLPPRNGSQ